MTPKRKILTVLGVVALAALALFGLWYWSISSLFHDMADTPYKYEETFSSPGGEHTVTVWRSDAVWSFGRASAKLVAASGGEEKEYETEIKDDGGSGTVEVRWLDSVMAQVTLRGQEQRDEVITVDFSEEIRITTSEGSGTMNQIAEQLSAYLGVPCTYFPPAKDDKAILDAYSAARERGSREDFVPMLIEAGEGSAETLVEQLYFSVDSGWTGDELDREAVEAFRREVLAQPLESGRKLLAGMQKRRAEEAAEDGFQWPDEDILGDFSEEAGEGTGSFSGIWGYGRPRMTVPVVLAEIPVENPWEVFAYLPFGGWNECPDTPELMAAAKYWYEAYGAVPAVMTHDVLEFSVPEPVSREQAKELAMEQYAFAPDIVDQGCERVSALASILADSTVWFFWWD